MRTIQVTASRNYEIKIGCGLLDALGTMIQELLPIGTAAIISDSNVFPIYGTCVISALKHAGFRVIHYVFPAGEENKCGTTYMDLLNFLAENQISRSDCLIALGGGVVGDLTGFTAATYLRGIPYIQIPTTVLAAVDSSVGGKTAIDLPAGKNLCGAFYQPTLVVCDLNTLNTLPEEIYRDGCAEIIKYGILYDENLFSYLERTGLNFHREEVISRCVELKRNVVNEDEFDTGSRMKLNLGHTLGHGVEKASHYTISHGKAVAIGTAMIARIAASRNMCRDEIRDRILNLLHHFGLPTHTDLDIDTLYECALSDKKRSADKVNLIIPETIGNCIIVPTPVDTLKPIIQEGL